MMPACPGVGFCVTGVHPKLLDPDFQERCDDYLECVKSEYGVYIPGKRRAAIQQRVKTQGLWVAAEVGSEIRK